MTSTAVEPGAAVLGAVARRNLGQTRRLRIGPAIGPGALELGDVGPPDGHRPDRTEASRPAASRPDPIHDLAVAGGPPSLPAGLHGPDAAADTRGTRLSVARTAAAAEPADGPQDDRDEPPDVLRSAAGPGVLERPVPARPIAPPRRVERAPLVGRLEVTQGGRSAPAKSAPGAQPPTSAPRSDVPTPRSTVQEALAALRGASTNVPSAAAASAAESGAAWAGQTIQRAPSDPSWTDPGTGSAVSAVRGDASTPMQSGTAIAASPIVARSAAAWSGPATGSGGAAAGSWSPPVRQLRAISPALADGSRRTGGHGVGGTIAPRSATSSGAGSGTAPSSVAPGGTLWRSVNGADGEGPDGPDTGDDGGSPSDTLQRLEAGATAADTGPITTVAAPIVQRAADGEGGAAAAAGGAGSDKELDELARKLFPRLQLRLRGELLIDRERIGALVDLGR